MQENTLIYNQSAIQYITYGNGNQPVVAFHGYGEDAISFSILEPELSNSIKLIVITLPLHGSTDWKESEFCHPDDILAIVEATLTKEQFSASQFSIAGYSLGGRICLKLLEKYPDRINHTLLLAPDGIKMFFLQYVATQNILSNKLFRFTIQYPQWFLAIVKLIKLLKIVNPSIADFVYRLMDSKEERTSLYNRWMIFKYLHPNIHIVRNNIVTKDKKVDIIIGEYDKLIKPSTLNELTKGIEKRLIMVHKLPTGHILMKEKFAAQIAALL